MGYLMWDFRNEMIVFPTQHPFSQTFDKNIAAFLRKTFLPYFYLTLWDFGGGNMFSTVTIQVKWP
jgi:hypothetical protein